MHIAKNLNYLKYKTEVTQKKLAQAIGKDRSAVNSYFIGKATPPVDVLIKICNFFEVTLDDMVTKDLEELSNIPSNGKSLPSPTKEEWGPGTKDLELRLQKIEKDIESLKQKP